MFVHIFSKKNNNDNNNNIYNFNVNEFTFFKYKINDLSFYKKIPDNTKYEIDIITGFFDILENYFDGPDANSLEDNCDDYIHYYSFPISNDKDTVILNIDRGVHNFEWFGKVLKCKFPNIKKLFIEQNYSNIIGKDNWRTFENLFIQLDLDILFLIDYQSELKYILNEKIDDLIIMENDIEIEKNNYKIRLIKVIESTFHT